ncbi:DUF6387 family protein [Burkholderia glumae]|uniref:DUF6387 family protein n=1 Tax=Burkholderia glumae TaxID=337 RepID=UPI00215183DC|nr:DUF6387 family protein [Burkholderia glumae]
MNNQKKILATVPDWFDLKKYDCVASLDIWGWHWNITHRLRLQHQLRFKVPEDFPFQVSQECRDEELDYARQSIRRHLEYPVARRNEPHSLDETSPREAVNDERVMDALYHAESILEDETYARAFEAHKFAMSTTEEWASKEAYKKSKPIEDSINEILAKKFPSSARYVYAEVDIGAPIEKLLESFEKWVRNVKQSRNQIFSKKKQFGESDFSKWERYRLLAYFDLALWAEMEGHHFSHDLYVKCLFPERSGDTLSFFRRTVKGEAESVFTWECSEALQAQANIKE